MIVGAKEKKKESRTPGQGGVEVPGGRGKAVLGSGELCPGAEKSTTRF